MIPNHKEIRTTLSKVDYNKLKDIGKQHGGVSVSTIARMIIREYLYSKASSSEEDLSDGLL